MFLACMFTNSIFRVLPPSKFVSIAFNIFGIHFCVGSFTVLGIFLYVSFNVVFIIYVDACVLQFADYTIVIIPAL